jgi:hypothetical protein
VTPGASPRRGPPPLRPFGLVLHHDGRFSHEGVPVTNPRLRAVFDRSVRYLPDEDKYVVQVGRFRGQVEPEEAAFFVRGFDPGSATLALSDGSRERLDVASLHLSPRDGALLCRVKRDLHPDGLLARFHHAAQAELLCAVEEGAEGPALRTDAGLLPLPDLEGDGHAGRRPPERT